MDSVRSCRECGIGFKRVGFLSANERIKVHEEIEHSVSCGECQDRFISLPHLRYHIETYHDARCGDCVSFCEKKCSIEYAMGIELAAEKFMEEGLAEKTEAAAAAARDLEDCIKKKIQLHTPLAADMTRLLDTGYDGPEAIYWSRLIYLPLPKTSERSLSRKVQRWVRLSDFEIALDEQKGKIKKIEVKKCPIQRCNASFFDEWSHRWDFHPDSSSRYWTSGPEVFEVFRADEQITPSAEDSNSKWQDDQIREIEKEIEEDTLEVATKKQEDSPGSSGTEY